MKRSHTSNMKTPKILNQIVDIVLAYRPKPKTKQAEKREEERKKAEKEDRKRESSI